jgi:hypothetical protein
VLETLFERVERKRRRGEREEEKKGETEGALA